MKRAFYYLLACFILLSLFFFTRQSISIDTNDSDFLIGTSWCAYDDSNNYYEYKFTSDTDMKFVSKMADGQLYQKNKKYKYKDGLITFLEFYENNDELQYVQSYVMGNVIKSSWTIDYIRME